MKYSRSWFVTMGLLALLPQIAVAQGTTGTITGTVSDRTSRQPVAEANVLVTGTNLGGRTGADGRFRIGGVPAGSVQLRTARIGYAPDTRTVTVGAGLTATVDFLVSVSALQLDAVVTSAVTGEAQRKREVGANVANIAVAEVVKGPITKLTDVLTGRTAGVTMQGTTGTTGTSQRIRIRGANSLSLSNEPLIYVDGNQVSNSIGLSQGVGGQAASRLNDINPDDIENIEVLKGPAAAALYGTAAANGVLLITTKRGRSGKPQWSTYVEAGSLEDKTDYAPNYYPYRLATPGAPLTTSTGAFNSAARPACFNYNRGAGLCTTDSVATFNTLLDPATRPFTKGMLQKYGASISGGSDQIRYYIAADKHDERGVIDYNTLNKVGFRANLNANLGSKLDVALSTGYVNSDAAFNSNDNSIFSPLINGLTGSAFLFPNLTSGRDSGKVNPRNYRQFTPANLKDYISYQDVDRFTVGAISNYRPLSWLRANGNVGLDYINRHDFRTLQPNRLPIAQSFTIGNRSSDRSNTYLITGSTSLEGKFELRSNLVSTTTVGGGYNRALIQTTNGFGAGIVEGTTNLGATSSLFAVGEGFNEVISVGAFARQEFALNDRIFIAGSLRGDDNSAFGTDFGFIYYPAASASWVVSEEPWFRKPAFLSNLRLRGAYGRSGLRPDFRDAATFFAPVSVTVAGAEQSAVTLSSTGNIDLKPERTDEVEFGADFGLFDNRVSFEATHYNKRSRDALISRPLPPSLGLTGAQLDNLGSVRNSGTELSLDTRLLEGENFGLNVRLTATRLNNKIEELGTTAAGDTLPDIVINRGAQRHQRGRAAGSFFQRPITFSDANGDGVLARSEVTLGDAAVYLGNSLPTYTRAASVDLRLFKYLRLATLFEARGGNQQLNFSEAFRCDQGVSFGDRGCSATGNTNASLEEQAAFIANRFGGAAPSRPGTSTAGFISSGSFVKWREASITLEPPASWTSFLRNSRGVSLTLAGRNLKTFTDYPGLDPEIVEAAGTSFNQSEFNTQPPVRYYTVRFNVNF